MNSVVLLFCLALTLLPASSWSEESTQQQLLEIKQEREKLNKLRVGLEKELGTLGKTLRKLDQELAKASRSSHKATRAYQSVSHELKSLQSDKDRLERRISKLKDRMQKEAALAYQHASRIPGWVDLFHGVSITEIPHRQAMLSYLLESQQQDREQYLQDIGNLEVIEAKLQVKQHELKGVKEIKERIRKTFLHKRSKKRELSHRIEKDIVLQKQRDEALKQQEIALKRLLESLNTNLSASDMEVELQSVRAMKGKFVWPLAGPVTTRFGHASKKGRPVLKGVHLAPRGDSRQVRAVAAGRIRYADWFGGYGLVIIVDHAEDLMTVYAHNDVLYHQLGDWVDTDELLAEAGSTGWIESTRLYFEVRDHGKPVNPARWCRKSR